MGRRCGWPARASVGPNRPSGGSVGGPGNPGLRSAPTRREARATRRSWERSPNVEPHPEHPDVHRRLGPLVSSISPWSTDRSVIGRRSSADRRAARSGAERPRFAGDPTASVDPVAWVHDMARLTSRAAAVLGARGGVRVQENSMTIHLDWLKTGRAPRGTPRRRGAPRRLVALGLIAGLALIQAGCQSGPFSNCGSCNSCGFFRRTTSRVFNRPSSCCGSSVVGGSPAVEYSAPSTVVGPRDDRRAACTRRAWGRAPSRRRCRCPTLRPRSNRRRREAGGAPGTGSTSRTGSGAGRTGYYTRQSATRTAVRLDSGLAPGRASVSRPARMPSDDARHEAAAATTTILSITCRPWACPAR